jgi:hypothetical protein
MSELINYNPDLIQRKIGVRESFKSKCTSVSCSVPYRRTNYGLRSPLSRIYRNVNLHSHNVEFYNIKYNNFKISLRNAV